MAVAALTFDIHIHTPCPTPVNMLNSNNKHIIWNLLLYNIFSSEIWCIPRDSLYVQVCVLESGLNSDGLQICVKDVAGGYSIANSVEKEFCIWFVH